MKIYHNLLQTGTVNKVPGIEVGYQIVHTALIIQINR